MKKYLVPLRMLCLLCLCACSVKVPVATDNMDGSKTYELPYTAGTLTVPAETNVRLSARGQVLDGLFDLQLPDGESVGYVRFEIDPFDYDGKIQEFFVEAVKEGGVTTEEVKRVTGYDSNNPPANYNDFFVLVSDETISPDGLKQYVLQGNIADQLAEHDYYADIQIKPILFNGQGEYMVKALYNANSGGMYWVYRVPYFGKNYYLWISARAPVNDEAEKAFLKSLKYFKLN